MTRPQRDQAISHVVAQMGLRASRVALRVPAFTDGHSMAHRGIHEVTSVWGGAGFVVVPVTSAEVHPAIVAALRAYDPDFVAVPDANWSIAPENLATLSAAQAAISAACANYRSPIAQSIGSPTMGELEDPLFSAGERGALSLVE